MLVGVELRQFDLPRLVPPTTDRTNVSVLLQSSNANGKAVANYQQTVGVKVILHVAKNAIQQGREA